MTTADFYLTLASNLSGYLALLLAALAIYFLALRKVVWSIFDPLFFSYLSAAFAASVVVFMYVEGQISKASLCSFLSTEVAFIVGFRVFQPTLAPARARTACKLGPHDNISVKVGLLLALLLFVVGQAQIYALHGIPAFSESRLQQHYDTSALGAALNKVVPVTRVLLVWFSMHCLFFRSDIWFRRFAQIAVGLVIVTYLLSGSKGGLIEMLFLLFVYQWWFRDQLAEDTKLRIQKNLRRALVVTVFLALAVIALRTDTTVGLDLLLYLAGRFIQSGDTFIYAYPNDALSFIPTSNFLAALFPGSFGSLFDVARSQPIGFQLAEYVNGYEMQEAPNTRHNVFGLLYFGLLGAPVYSFVLGFTLRLFSRTLYHSLNKDCFTGAIFATVYLSIAGLQTDANLALGVLTGSIVLAPLIVSAALLGGTLLGKIAGSSASSGHPKLMAADDLRAV